MPKKMLKMGGGGNECRIVLVLATEMLRKVSGRIYELKSHTENFTQKTTQSGTVDKNMKVN